jgi:hypothetical protein
VKLGLLPGAGGTQRSFKALGFSNVINENKDFYEVVKNDEVPEHDVLVTNPPYSEDHIERILKFCVGSGKPWFLLVPNFVYVNPYYTKAMDEAKAKPFYLVPTTRYWYTAPTGARAEKAQRTSPFLSFWYCDLAQPDVNAAFVSGWRAKQGPLAAGGPTRPTLAGHLNQLPHSMRAQYDPTRRRLRKKQREAHDRKTRKREAERDKGNHSEHLRRGRGGLLAHSAQLLQPRDAEPHVLVAIALQLRRGLHCCFLA